MRVDSLGAVGQRSKLVAMNDDGIYISGRGELYLIFMYNADSHGQAGEPVSDFYLGRQSR